jgi:hypothetical protein
MNTAHAPEHRNDLSGREPKLPYFSNPPSDWFLGRRGVLGDAVREWRTCMMKMNTARAAFYTVTDTKKQFGAGVAHIYDENVHHAQRSSRIQRSNLVREWHTFMMEMNTAHSVLHRHGYKVTIWCRSGAHL